MERCGATLAGMIAYLARGIFIAVLSFSSVSKSFAQTSDAAARTHFSSGRLYYESGNYEAALREFEEAYRLSRRIDLLFNIALAYEGLERFDDSADALETYRRAHPDLDATVAQQLNDRIAELRSHAAASPNDSVAPTMPEPDPVPSDGETSDPPNRAIDSDGSELSSWDILGITGLAIGGVGLTVFGILAALATTEDASLAGECGRDAGRVCSDSRVSTLLALTTSADIALVSGLVFASAGATALVIGALEADSDSVAVLPIIDQRVLALEVRGLW